MPPETLAALHALCFPGAPPPWSAESFAALLRDPHVKVLEDAQARGFAVIRIVGDEGELLTLAVDPAHRRQGIARALIDRMDGLARTQGAQTVFLEVAETNTAARALYAACGFRQVGRRPGYYRAPGQIPAAALILCKSPA